MSTARQIALDAWKAATEDQDDIDLVEIAARIDADLRTNPEYVNAYLSTSREFVYDIGMDYLIKKRSMVRESQRVMTPAALREKIATEAGHSSWDDWQERDPASRRYHKLLDMSKEQLIAAATVREGRSRGDLIDAAMMRLMAGRLKSGQVAREVWTPDALTDLRQKVRVEFTIAVDGIKKEVKKTLTAAGAAVPSLAAD